jgi:hypothetical protein
LADAFTAAVNDGTGAPANATLYPETAVLGTATPSVDPATLVGQAVTTFDLGLNATGSVIAVDDSPVEGVARSRLMANVGSDYRLITDSVDIEQGPATVANGEVSFPVTASASRVRGPRPGELLALVKGKSFADAKAALAPFGRSRSSHGRTGSRPCRASIRGSASRSSARTVVSAGLGVDASTRVVAGASGSP